jgi:prepilin-type N-terminal cleavage/methylation domain-containing protein
MRAGNREQGIGNRSKAFATRRGGFTLMELLVAMAVSSILLFLVIYPVINSLKMTRQAQAMVEAQDCARMSLAAVSRELGQAMFVFDNAQGPIDIDTTDVPTPPAAPQTPIMLPVAQPCPGNGKSALWETQWFVLPYAKIDFILPKIYLHCNNPDHPADKPRDFPRSREITTGGSTRTELYGWMSCPYCGSNDVEAKPKLPLEQDVTVVRYFLGLRHNNLDQPIDPPDIPLINKGWVQPWGRSDVVEGTQNAVVLYRVEFNPYDDSLFPAGMPIDQRLADPFFFYRQDTCANWARIVRVVGIGKYEDLVTATYDANGNVTSIEPTIAFRTASVENDTFNPAFSSDIKSEYPDATPTVFAGSYGYWTPDYHVDVMRGNYCDNPPGGVDYYTTIQGGDEVVMRRVPDTSGGWTETVEFNMSRYWADGFVPPDSAGKHALEMAYTVDVNRGTVNFALQPPRPAGAKVGPVCELGAAGINDDFHAQYALDRGGAIRRAWLPTLALDPKGTPEFADQYIENARIVPGSEKIIGPDMTFGPHFGMPIRYNRVPLELGDPEENQYKIDYDTGWLFFSRDPSLDLPEQDPSSGKPLPARVMVYYLIYLNQKDDVVRADYLTKSLINIHFGMRMFDPDGGKPYPVDLSDKVKIRNAVR